MALGWLAAVLVAALSTLSAPVMAPVSKPLTAPQKAVLGPAGCAGVPRSLSDRAAGDAIAAIPSLSALAAGISAADLANELNRRPQVTIFAPTNEAVAKVSGKITLDVAILRYHVVPQRLAPERLLGTHRTLHGTSLSVVRSASHVQVNATAGLICTRVQVANGNVYLIDALLTPR